MSLRDVMDRTKFIPTNGLKLMKKSTTLDMPRFLGAAKCLLDIIPDGIIITEPSGRIAYANESAARLLERSTSELVGLDTKEINKSGWEGISKVFKDGLPQHGVRTTVNGKLFIAGRLPLKLNNRIEAVVSFFQGMFAYDQYALELESYKYMAKLLDAIMESSYDGLWITDREGMIVKLNKAAERLTGCTAQDVLGRNVTELVERGFVDESVTGEVLKRKTTVTMVQKTKADKIVLATGSPIFDSSGNIDVIIINDRDITELNRMRHELEESKALVDLYRQELFDVQLKDLDSDFFLCKSRIMETVYEAAARSARFETTVLLTGESGVGKGLLAKLIHRKSGRSQGPFIRVDCGAIVETLFESELFGHERGAFTGAGPRGKLGLLDMANGGTLFLDEIAEVPLAQQVKLLRFLDEKSLVRVGGSEVRTVDTRVIAATNKDLEEEVHKRRFRKDLFYRFNVVSLRIPPLRERQEDILGLITFFMNKMSKKHGLHKRLDRDALDALLHYRYPGNVRELENMVESMMIMSQMDTITVKDLHSNVREALPLPDVTDEGEAPDLPGLVDRIAGETVLRAVEKYGSQQQAALHLGIHQSTVSRKLKKLRNLSEQ
ncbi:MAG: sigma 54-interacting transcriptional regulator [Desulfomonilaceae bacterium]|nr:sigma 54-interacting transcriptional regulator [Desulfomonilaceae bacterium]